MGIAVAQDGKRWLNKYLTATGVFDINLFSHPLSIRSLSEMSSAFTRYSIETRPVDRRQKNMIPFFLDGVIRARIRLSLPRRRAFYSDKVKNRLYLEFESFLNFRTLLIVIISGCYLTIIPFPLADISQRI